MIHALTVQLPNNFRSSNKKKFIKFNGCAFQYYVNGKIETVDNVSIHSNIANTSNTIGTTNNVLYFCFKQNPNKRMCENCKNEGNCDSFKQCIKCGDCNKCRDYTDHTGCNIHKEIYEVVQSCCNGCTNCFCNDFIGMTNNYLVQKTYQVNNIDHFEVYFVNSLGERLCIFDKIGNNIIQASFKLDLELEY
jgi:hypothetical protein